VVAGIRQQLHQCDVGEAIPNNDRELVERYVDRIVLKTDTIEVWWSGAVRQDEASVGKHWSELRNDSSVTVLPWTSPTLKVTKGIIHAPAGRTMMQPETREALLSDGVVRTQREVGVDVPDDGEFGKPMSANYDGNMLSYGGLVAPRRGPSMFFA
jgi:hypothetical protein